MRRVGLGFALLAGIAGLALSAAGQASPPVAAGAAAPVAAGTAAAAGTVTSAAAAVGTDAAYVPTMTFDVASVRQMKVGNSFTMGGGWINPHSSMLRLEYNAIDNLLVKAYGIQTYQLVGLPDWSFPTLFTVEAKSDTEADEKLAKLNDKDAFAEKEHMLQGVLADRFKLRSHWETREGPTYDLVVSKAGRLEGSKTVPPTAEESKIFGDGPIAPLMPRNDGRGRDLIGHACPMPYLVQWLTDEFNQPVSDKTGRTGKYDFFLKYDKARVSDPTPDENDPMPSLEDALQDQLGLKLVSAKGPIRVLVIDHVEKPSEN